MSLNNRIEILEPKIYSKLIKEIFREKKGDFFLDIKTTSGPHP